MIPRNPGTDTSEVPRIWLKLSILEAIVQCNFSSLINQILFRGTFKRMRSLLIRGAKFDHMKSNVLKLQIRKLKPSENLRLAQGHWGFSVELELEILVLSIVTQSAPWTNSSSNILRSDHAGTDLGLATLTLPFVQCHHHLHQKYCLSTEQIGVCQRQRVEWEGLRSGWQWSKVQTSSFTLN